MTGLLFASALSLLTALKELSASGGGVYELEDSEYHFAASEATPMKFFVSNHDQVETRPVFLPLTNLTNVTLRAKEKARFIFHGLGVGLYLHNTKNVKIDGITFEWADPSFTTAEIVDFENGHTLIRPREPDRIRFEKGNLLLSGENWCLPVAWGNIFDAKTHAILAGQGDVALGPVTDCGSDVYSVSNDFSKVGIGAKKGDIWLLRSYWRPHPVICLDHAVDSTFLRVTFRDGFGMGVLAQMCENITFRKCACTPRNANEVASNTIDAIHLANCRGHVAVLNSTFEGMMDDALNVHATSLSIVAKPDARSIRCRFMHPQAYGLDLFRPGDLIRFIAAKTLENGPVLKLKSIEVHDPLEVTLRFAKPVPTRYAIGDAIENASWSCSVDFIGNTVKNNRARGILLTTPKRVVCRANMFENVSGSAILLAGDAQGWYESGACNDVEITKNRFVKCLTSPYQFCVGLISIYPEVSALKRQTIPYHRNIRIEKNNIYASEAPLLYAQSAEAVLWRDNYVDKMPESAFIVDPSADVTIE